MDALWIPVREMTEQEHSHMLQWIESQFPFRQQLDAYAQMVWYLDGREREDLEYEMNLSWPTVRIKAERADREYRDRHTHTDPTPDTRAY